MKIRFLHGADSKRLILIFAGWAMDHRPFDNLLYPGYRIAVVWDYTYESLDTEMLEDFDEICVLAWSYGVFMAARFMASHPELPITATVAVNGTMHPIDRHCGIDPGIFDATLQGLSRDSVAKFYRRMCGGAAAFAEFSGKMPQRTLDSLVAELRNIAEIYARDGAPEWDWDYAFISSKDLIIPSSSQLNAWSDSGAVIKRRDGAHLPDFTRLLDEAFIKKAGVTTSFTKAADTYEDNATVQKMICEILAGIIRERVAKLSGDVLEIGCGSGMFTRELMRIAESDISLTLMDVVLMPPTLPGRHIVCDAELGIRKLPAGSLDAIVSASTVQWFNSPRRFMKESLRVLRPGGVLAVAIYGASTFKELPDFTSPSRLYDIEELKSMVPAGFEISFIDDMCTQIYFDTPMDLLRHFRLTGVSPSGNSVASTASARAIIASGITRLTYNPIFLLLTRNYS